MKHLKYLEHNKTDIQYHDLVKPIDTDSKYYKLIFKVTQTYISRFRKWECEVVWDPRKENHLIGMAAEYFPYQLRKLTPEEMNNYQAIIDTDKYNL